MDSHLETEPEASDNSEALLRRYRAGEVAAIEMLIVRYYPRIERMVRIRLGAAILSTATVADVVQDVFVRVLKSLDRFEPRKDAQWIDWVATLARNEAIDHGRRARIRRPKGEYDAHFAHASAIESVSRLPAETTAVSSKVSRRELIALVDQHVSELSEDHREVILLRDYAGASWEEVVAKLGRTTPEACQQLHRRARRELLRRLQDVV